MEKSGGYSPFPFQAKLVDKTKWIMCIFKLSWIFIVVNDSLHNSCYFEKPPTCPLLLLFVHACNSFIILKSIILAHPSVPSAQTERWRETRQYTTPHYQHSFRCLHANQWAYKIPPPPLVLALMYLVYPRVWKSSSLGSYVFSMDFVNLCPRSYNNYLIIIKKF